MYDRTYKVGNSSAETPLTAPCKTSAQFDKNGRSVRLTKSKAKTCMQLTMQEKLLFYFAEIPLQVSIKMN